MARIPGFRLHTDLNRRLFDHHDETIVFVVHKHWAAYTKAALFGALGILLWCAVPFSSPDAALAPIVLGLVALAWAGWLAINLRMDRFVVTNYRVFRTKGILGRSTATVPLGRILDIAVVIPPLGQLVGYGHFVFESAAQEQGLREIRYVPRPDQINRRLIDLMIHLGMFGPGSPNRIPNPQTQPGLRGPQQS